MLRYLCGLKHAIMTRHGFYWVVDAARYSQQCTAFIAQENTTLRNDAKGEFLIVKYRCRLKTLDFPDRPDVNSGAQVVYITQRLLLLPRRRSHFLGATGRSGRERQILGMRIRATGELDSGSSKSRSQAAEKRS